MPAEIKQDIFYNFITNTAMAIEGFQRLINAFFGLDEKVKKVEKDTASLNKTLSSLTAAVRANLIIRALAKTFGLLKTAIGLVKGAFDNFVASIKAPTMLAARIEVQLRTLALTAGNAGERFEDVVKHLNSLRAAGIKTGEAIQILSQFLANELPIKMVTELARRAQDMAVVIGTDSTEAFQRFNNFLQTGNSEWIRTMGIMKTGNQMLEAYARTQNKVVSAMTDREQKEALVQGLMKETLRYEGAYEEAMKDPYKRWTSLPRLISNVTEALGSLFVPMMGTAVDVASDALEKIERLFRVTKKEAKETGEVLGTWKEGFLRLRAVVTAFANWFMSIWNRLTSGFGDQAEGMMDRFVNAIVRGVQAAAAALRRFATFVATVFGGRAPAEVTAAGIAAVKPPAKPEGAPRVAPPAAEPYEELIGKPKKPRKIKPVEPVKREDLQQLSILTGAWAKATAKLAQATKLAAKARAALAAAEERLEAASEKVYDIRRKIERLELAWAEIPERFIRGRKRQLQLELQAAEHAEHERKKERDAEQDRFRAAEKFRRGLEQTTKALKRNIDTLINSIERQAERYADYLEKLREAEQQETRLITPIQAIVNEFESLDDLLGVYLEEIEGQLMPAFASIEESVGSIVSSLKVGWETTKAWTADMLKRLGEIRQWWGDLPDWVKNILKGLGIAVALNFLPGVGIGTVISKILVGAFTAAGLIPGVGWTIAAGAIALFIAIKPFLSPEVREAWKEAWDTIWNLSGDPVTAMGEAAETTLEHSFFAPLLEWVDKSNFVQDAFQKMFEWSPVNWITGGEWGKWAGENVVDPIYEQISGAEGEMKDAAESGIERPLTDTMERMSRNLVGESLIPDMVNAILDWMRRLAERLGDYLDQMAAKFRILEMSIRGLEPALIDVRKFVSGGSIKVVNIKGPFNIGSDLTESDVRGAIYDAIASLPGL